MSHPNKVRGTRWESAIRDFLIARGRAAVERRSLYGNKDRGDFAGIPNWTVDAKDEAKISLATYMDECEVEAANAGTRFYAAIVKRRRQGVADAYVVMPLRVWADLIDVLDTAPATAP